MVTGQAWLAELRAAREAEREQIAFYRALAVDAERAGNEVAAERLNGMLADEQHHYSRLVARLMELDGTVPESGRTRASGFGAAPVRTAWEVEARIRERAEIERYEALLRHDLDARTRVMIEEFLAAERGHEQNLGGKWMGA